MAEGFVKKLYRTADVVKYIFCMACRVRSPMLKTGFLCRGGGGGGCQNTGKTQVINY